AVGRGPRGLETRSRLSAAVGVAVAEPQRIGGRAGDADLRAGHAEQLVGVRDRLARDDSRARLGARAARAGAAVDGAVARAGREESSARRAAGGAAEVGAVALLPGVEHAVAAERGRRGRGRRAGADRRGRRARRGRRGARAPVGAAGVATARLRSDGGRRLAARRIAPDAAVDLPDRVRAAAGDEAGLAAGGAGRAANDAGLTGPRQPQRVDLALGYPGDASHVLAVVGRRGAGALDLGLVARGADGGDV